VLDGVSDGVWRINEVRRTNGRMMTRDGTRAYVMDAEVDVTVVKAVRRQDFIASSLKMLVDVWNGKTWLLSIIGRSGDRRVVSMQLLWIEKEKGWEFLGPCSDCVHDRVAATDSESFPDDSVASIPTRPARSTTTLP